MSYKLKYFVVILSLFITCSNYGQIIIKSKIIDIETNKPLPFVNIYIKNTTIGTISNTDGVFKLQISKDYINGSLLISSIGFKTKEILIKELNNGNISIIKLEVDIVLLEEVVLGKKYTASQIVKKAFANYYKNFPTEPFIAKGFLRHTEKTKKEYKWLVEAAIEVYDPGFHKKSKKIKTNVKEVRKSIDNRQMDTLIAYKLCLEEEKGLSFRKAWIKTPALHTVSKEEIQKAINYYDRVFTLPGWKKTFFYSLFNTDINKIRYFNQKKATLDRKRIDKKFSFKIDTTLMYDNDEVYKIKISAPKKIYKGYGKNFVYFGWLYIRKKDFAILELELFSINKRVDNAVTKLLGSKLRSNLTVKFTEINGKIYPKYLSYKSPKLNRLREVSSQYRNKEKINSEYYYFSTQEVIFTEIITDTKIINQRLKEPWDDNLFKPRPYNATFWKNYNIFPETEEQQKMIQDLEKKVNLKEQFSHKKIK